MGSRGRLVFDLNEPPIEDDEGNDCGFSVQPQKAVPSAIPPTSDLFSASSSSQLTVSNSSFSHVSSVSGFQPFVRPKAIDCTGLGLEHKRASHQKPQAASKSSNSEQMTVLPPEASGYRIDQVSEIEEGECSEAEASGDAHANSDSYEKDQASHSLGISNAIALAHSISHVSKEHSSRNLSNTKYESSLAENTTQTTARMDHDLNSNNESNGRRISESIPKEECGQEEPTFSQKHTQAKGIETNYAIKCANNPGNRKIDQHKETMLGKKRNRQTVFLNLEDVKQAGPIKNSTPRRQNSTTPVTTRTVKELRALACDHVLEKQSSVVEDQKQLGISSNETSVAESCEPKPDCNDDTDHGPATRARRLNNEIDHLAEVPLPPVSRQSSWKQTTDCKPPKISHFPNRKPALIGQSSNNDTKLGNKKSIPTKKMTTSGTPYQDTSVERLIREVTNEKFWRNPDDSELQSVPGRFESPDEYVRVFEPLLFEECRAQLYSTWEELTEPNSKDTHVMVRIKSVERRERGWYDVIVIPTNECKWSFKEGDVAVISSARPEPVRLNRNNSPANGETEDSEATGRVVGTVRRHFAVDTRDLPGAIVHFYVGDSYDSSSKIDENHALRKLQPRGIWYLTVLGSLATTQREYIALHAFCRLNSQMQRAILNPSIEHFPKYEQQTPATPDCFTQIFADHLHKSFNAPQLAAIQWAAMHTAAGTSSGTTKRQDPWPFTLVQGPPGTGKTHTVWGMLNVIHLVQYQHYYTSLLKKLAPESYKQTNETNPESFAVGSIDQVLQNMDQNLFRTLPKLCPKPKMLVCAPSNAATDELLSRVLDRGFIDGEMRVYRPDVARVGVDSQTRAAQAVSVERRTEQLLLKSREDIIGWMHNLRGLEAKLSHDIANHQRELNLTAAAIRSQGSVGVDPEILTARDQNRDALLQNLAAAVEARDKALVEMSRLLILESRFRAGSGFNLEEARANLEASFANEAEIVFTTLSSSGRRIFSRLTHGFDMVVIDEAAQASEVGILPPLSLGAARCVLVGDPQQLPATVISKAAGTLLYSRSLFERFQQAGCPTMLLSVQYRMHPQIRDFPSRYFYQGRLSDSESVINLPDEMYFKDPLLKPYMFFDITHGRESHRGGSVSYQNFYEAEFCHRLFEHLQKTLKSLGSAKVSVGIITPYKLQLKCIQREFDLVLKSDEGKDLYINTVDAFQGQERDVIIMSCVRASGHGVGFVSDIRRMNVALTRARRSLWVMGNANSLMQSDDWAALIADAKARNCYMDMDSLPKDFWGSKPPSSVNLSNKFSSNMRGLRTTVPRHKSVDMHMESSRSGMPPPEDDKSGPPTVSRNGNFRSYKLPNETYLATK